MKIVAIETSCDETAISVVECKGDIATPLFQPLSEVVLSQLALHAHWGGVVPTLAKREHEKALVPVLQEALLKAKLLGIQSQNSKGQMTNEIQISNILNREQTLLPEVIKFLETYDTPDIDALAVTQGPGLEPALWVGINFAKALAMAWQKPLIPVNHMEGHLLSPLLSNGEQFSISLPADATHQALQAGNFQFPLIALLVSGGHTELVLVKAWGDYQKIGQTRDDAAGEAFDKVARLLGLGYPGGPAIAAMAAKFQSLNAKFQINTIQLPRPMINSGDYDFSFSGLKTAVLYLVKKLQENDPLVLERDEVKASIAYEFQEAVVDVLISKTTRAVEEYGAKSIIVGGGVSANKRLRESMERSLTSSGRETSLHFPTQFLSTDNATMIAAAGYIRWLEREKYPLPNAASIQAEGNLCIGIQKL